MLDNFKDVLVLAPHTDDGELGAGGTISKLIESGACVTYVAFSTAEQSLPDGLPKNTLSIEVKAATKVLGIEPKNLYILNYEVRRLNYFRQELLEDLISLRNQNSFDLILTPSTYDVHQDHAVVTQEAVRAFKNNTILGYELVWNNLQSTSECISILEKKHIKNKIESLKKYQSQSTRNYLSLEFIFALAKVRGTQIGVSYGEAFEVIRLILK